MLSPPNPGCNPGLKTGLALGIPGSPKKCRLIFFGGWWLLHPFCWVGVGVARIPRRWWSGMGWALEMDGWHNRYGDVFLRIVPLVNHHFFTTNLGEYVFFTFCKHRRYKSKCLKINQTWNIIMAFAVRFRGWYSIGGSIWIWEWWMMTHCSWLRSQRVQELLETLG